MGGPGGAMGGGMGGGGMMPQGMGGAMPQGMGGYNLQDSSQAVHGIAKNMSWKILFFLAGCCTLAAATISILFMIFSFEFAPFSFTTILFMLLFGILMVILDFPVPRPSPTLASVRAHIYKFFLFLTRFTGRGVWYLFMGTMIFATLFDLDINQFFGIVMGGYVGLVGIASLVFGIRLSNRLDAVRQELLLGDKQCPPNGYSKDGFRALSNQVAKMDFTDDELDYVFNSLSFNPMNDGLITPEEYKQWLLPGKMEIV